MKKALLTLLILLIIPITVSAKTKTYEVCQEGCEYNRLAEVIIDANLLRDEYDVVINFKDEGPYYLIKDEQDFQYIENKIEEVCTANDGVWDGYDCRSNDYYQILGSKTYIFNSKLSSVTFNGVENKTMIYPTGIFSMSELLNALTFPGIINSNFEMNNIKLTSSAYFSAIEKDVKGKINNCDIKHGILVSGNVNLEISNSKINNVYSIGSELFEEEITENIYDSLKDPVVIIDKSTTTFYKKYFKYSEKVLNDLFTQLEEYIENYEYDFNVPYPLEENYASYDDYLAAVDSWVQEYEEWELNSIENFTDIIKSIKGSAGLDREDYLQLITSFMIDGAEFSEQYNDLIEEYISEHPMPDENNTDEYQQWLKEFNQEFGSIIINENLFPSTDEVMLKLFSGILFPGDDGTFSNVIELANGKVYFKDGIEKSIQMNQNLDFQGITQVLGTSIDGWEMSNNDIIKISNGKIIPLKVGSVELRKQTQDDIYVINIEITPDMLINPNTGTGISIIIIITILLVSSITYMIFKGRKIIL